MSAEERVPGARFVVRFADDAWAHERLVLWPVHMGGRGRQWETWMIETPDGDRYAENVRDWIWQHSLADGYPVDFEGDVVSFERPFDLEEMRAMVTDGRDLARAERRRRRLPVTLGGTLGEEPGYFLDWDGGQHGIPEHGVARRAFRRMTGKQALPSVRRVEASPGRRRGRCPCRRGAGPASPR